MMTSQQPLVLIMDDEQAIVDLINDVLVDEGFRCVSVPTPQQALELIIQQQPDLVILDLYLKGAESGLALLRQMRDDPTMAQTPVIVCSADRETLYAAAAQITALSATILEKPFSITTLIFLAQQLVAQGRASTNSCS